MIRVSILGLGASGTAAARLALSQGEEVHVSDLRTDPEVDAAGAELRKLGARVDLGSHDVDVISGADLVVVSPGIPPAAPVLRALRERGIRWISEPEFAVRFYSGSLIAVTGTNGKTTTAALTAHLLAEGGVVVGLGGNIGGGLGPAASELALLDPQPDWVVLEVSSFQLADIDTFQPDIGVLTNLAPDHQDRYADLASYYADKSRIFDNAVPESRWVLNRDQPEVAELAGDVVGERYWFGLEGNGFRGGYLRDGVLTLDVGSGPVALLAPGEMQLLGRHNVANALTASVTAALAGASVEAIRTGLRSFRALPHRLEPVGQRDGVLWVNDSKATNVAAARSAVLSLLPAPMQTGEGLVVLLLGGMDKRESLDELAGVLPGRVRAVVCYGEVGRRFADALDGLVPVVRSTGSFDEAVAAGAAAALPGDLLVLAPATSSYDQFRNYGERGDRFRALARGEA